MKILVLSTSSNETGKYSDGLAGLGHAVTTLAYDITEYSEQWLYSKSKEAAPDLIVYIGSRWGKQPSISTLAKMQSVIAPSIHLCSDACDPPWHDLLREYHDKGAFTLQVNIDGNPKWPCSDSGLTLLTPVSAKNFPVTPPAHELRTHACGFAGNAGGGPVSERTKLLSDLLGRRIIDFRSRSGLPYTYEGYCAYLTMCRLSLNIAYSGTEQTMQVKGRVVESALAGSCLLENAGAPTSNWFRPGIDYLEYKDADQAANIIASWPTEETEAMATRMRERVLAEHSIDQFWARVFDRMGIKG